MAAHVSLGAPKGKLVIHRLKNPSLPQRTTAVWLAPGAFLACVTPPTTAVIMPKGTLLDHQRQDEQGEGAWLAVWAPCTFSVPRPGLPPRLLPSPQ